ncbi:MAG TPA: autotransporter domain-containing protein [Xanthobacteraceae bacterium]|nr:autotransporter domain-containing protein [Xanthobacteraceae bacterium]
MFVAVGLGVGSLASTARAEDPVVFTYETLKYGSADTFLTGIRGSNIVGNYVIPGTTETGGIYYNMATQTWSPMPVATENGANFPGAIGSSPYGPSFGTPAGILRVVGTYQTEASAPYDLSYVYDGAAAPGQQITTLIYPSGPSGQTLFTVAHSNFGNQVVGDYDTDLATGNAFIYNTTTGTYTTNNIPGAISTTAYGIYGDKIAGGYAMAGPGGEPGFEHGYIYDQSTGTYKTYDHPGAIATHFEGITGAGRAGEYNLVANWITPDGVTHPAVLHVAADGTTTWYEIDIPGEVVSSNSAYGDNVVGIYIADGEINGYVATIPGMYNPIRNETPLVVSVDGATGIATNPGGDDVINSSTILVSGKGSTGIKGETYGVLTNAGTITVTGLGSTGVQMNGLYGTLLNEGTIKAAPGAYAITTGPTASGTAIVNTGIIDGRILVASGPDGRFENSGWLGISAPGAGVTSAVSGTFAQTSAGTLALRIGADSNDMLEVTGAARLSGTVAVDFQSDHLLKSYTLLTASEAITGTFQTLTTDGLPAMFASGLGYGAHAVTLNVASNLAGQPGISRNQKAVGGAIDGYINGAPGNALAMLPAALDPLYDLSAGQLPVALNALSGEAYASEQSVLIGDTLYSRQAMLGRLRQGAYDGASGAVAALAFGGPALAYAAPAQKASPAPFPTKAPSPAPEPGFAGTVWAQAFGGWTDLDGDANAASVKETIGGFVSGADVRLDNWLVGAALGYSRSSADIDALASSSDVDSLLLALYAGTRSGPWNLRVGASYAFNSIDASRTIAYPGYSERADADYDGGTTQLFAEVGYGFAAGSVALEPFAGIAWVNLDTDGFTETGASAGLTAASASAGVGYSSLGLRAATRIALSGAMVLEPHASLAWQYAFGDTTPTAQLAFISIPGANFTVGGAPLAENTALVEIGADLHLSPAASIGVSYLGQFADDVALNAVQGNVTWRF